MMMKLLASVRYSYSTGSGYSTRHNNDTTTYKAACISKSATKGSLLVHTHACTQGWITDFCEIFGRTHTHTHAYKRINTPIVSGPIYWCCTAESEGTMQYHGTSVHACLLASL